MSKTFFNWSGGKDSALALHRLREIGRPQISCLLTTVNEKFNRISMHGVRRELLGQQAAAIGIPLVEVLLPEMPDMDTYERIMGDKLFELKVNGFGTSVFGDIFLEDLKKYREEKLSKLGLKCLFPLWNARTDKLVEEFIELGFKAITVCVNDKYLGREFVGRIIDKSFLSDLPRGVDPCGENGEFHSFVYDGPIFSMPVKIDKGEIIYRKYGRKEPLGDKHKVEKDGIEDPFENGFWYCDLLTVG